MPKADRGSAARFSREMFGARDALMNGFDAMLAPPVSQLMPKTC